MDEKPDQIIDHIESQRSQLGRNLDELENRVRSTADWRTHFDRNPMLLMGVALGGGILLGSIVGGRSSSSSGHRWSSSRHRAGSSSTSYPSASYATGTSSPSAFAHQRQKASETIDQVKAALIAFGITKAKDFLQEAIPGFGGHLAEAERRTGYETGRSTSSSGADYGASAGGYAAGGFGTPGSGSVGSGGAAMPGSGPYSGQSRGGSPHSSVSETGSYKSGEPAGVGTPNANPS
jgi:hypothetical protein